MSCITIIDREENYFCFACNTTDVVFGPLFYVSIDDDIDEVVKLFREYIGIDPRMLEHGDLLDKWYKFSLDDITEEILEEHEDLFERLAEDD